jgi:predicted ATPase
MYAAVVLSITRDARLAYAFSRLAIDLDQRLTQTLSPPVAFLHAWFINHWINPLETNVLLAEEGAHLGLVSGDLLYGCFNAADSVMYRSLLGTPLEQVLQAAETQIAVVQGRVLVSSFHCILERQMALALMGRTRHRLSLTDDRYDEQNDLASIFATSNFNQMGYFYVAKMRLHYCYGDYETAFDYSEKALPLLAAFRGQVVEWDFAFYRALAALGRAHEVESTQREPLLIEAENLLKSFHAWAELCPSTFLHKRDLISAELSSLRNSPATTARAYATAIASASASGFSHDLAMAHECAARHFAATKQSDLANLHARAALGACVHWQAWAKGRHIHETLLSSESTSLLT